MKNIELDVQRIKCDNPDCDYIENIVIKNYKDWIDEPCPKCGAPLYTEKDHQAMMTIKRLIKVINSFPSFSKDKKLRYRIQMEMNGTGNIEFSKAEEIKESESEISENK